MALDYSMLFKQPPVSQQIMQGMQQYQQGKAFEADQERADQKSKLEAATAERAAQFRTEFGAAKTPQERVALAGQYPEMIETIKSISGMDSEIKQNVIGEISMQMTALSGDPEAAKAYIQENADVFESLGPAFNVERLFQQIETNPAGLVQSADMMAMVALGPEKYQELMGKRADQNLAERQFTETQANNTFDQGIKRQEMGFKQRELQLKQLDNQGAAIDRQIARETNQVQLETLKDNRAAKQVEREQAKADMQAAGESAVGIAQRGMDTVDDILGSDGFESAVGARSPLSFLPGSAAKETFGMIENLQSQIFLNEVEKMKGSGALSDSEGKKLSASIASLDPQMSEKALRRSLGIIKGYFSTAKDKAATQYGITPPSEEKGGAIDDSVTQALLNKYAPRE
jgi:hypothetical protein